MGVCATTGVGACVGECTCVGMHCLCVCAHVYRCQSCCGRRIRGWAGSSERKVWEADCGLHSGVKELGTCG